MTLSVVKAQVEKEQDIEDLLHLVSSYRDNSLPMLVGHINLTWVVYVDFASCHMRVNTILMRNLWILLHTCIVAHNNDCLHSVDLI